MDMCELVKENLKHGRKTYTDYGLISIIMPCYNAASFLRDTIDSVIAQTYPNWELLFVDDCSSDNSLEIISQYEDPRIKVMRNAVNGGATVSRNNAIRAAQGKWIAFLDSDDLWMEDKLAKHLAYMVENDIAFSCTHYSVFDSTNEQVALFAPSKSVYDYKTILKHCYIGCSTVIYDREKLGKVYMPAAAVKREDFACWLQILKTGIVAVCYPVCLTKYRVHDNSVSANKLKMIRYQWNVYRNIEHMSFWYSVYCMVHWAVRGVLKYR